MCESLKNYVAETVRRLKQENAPNFIINDTTMDLMTGDAVMCDGCEEYNKCFPEN